MKSPFSRLDVVSRRAFYTARTALSIGVVMSGCGAAAAATPQPVASTPQPSYFSSSEPAASPLTSGTQVGGSCKTVGHIATPTDLGIVNRNLSDALTFAGKAITQALQAQASTLNNTLTAMLDAQTKIEKGMLQAQAASDYINSVTGANAFPTAGSVKLANNPCLMQSTAQAILSGQAVQQAIGTQIYSTAMKGVAPVRSTNAAVASAAAAGPSAYTPTSLFPDPDRPATAASAAAYIRNLVTPIPPESIPANQRDTAAGRIARANLNALTARQSLAVEALQHIAQQHIPSVPASAAFTLWRAAGFPGNPPETDGTRISSDGMLQVLVDTRFANPEFYKALYTGGEVYALRSYALELATQLSIQQKQIDALERLVAINAAALSAQTAEQRTKLNTIRAAAAMQTVIPGATASGAASGAASGVSR
jgi:hypothetical protein